MGLKSYITYTLAAYTSEGGDRKQPAVKRYITSGYNGRSFMC